jgi:hypothetical protein
VFRESSIGSGSNRNEAHVVELFRRLEEHAVPVLLLALGRGRGPGGIASRKLELVGVCRFVLLPPADLAREIELGERAAEELAFDCHRIDLRGFFRFDFMQGAALDEKALH